jgi:hypothetical protein
MRSSGESKVRIVAVAVNVRHSLRDVLSMMCAHPDNRRKGRGFSASVMLPT